MVCLTWLSSAGISQLVLATAEAADATDAACGGVSFLEQAASVRAVARAAARVVCFMLRAFWLRTK